MKLLRETIRRLILERIPSVLESNKEEMISMLRRDYPDCTIGYDNRPGWSGFEIHHKSKARLWKIQEELEDAGYYMSMPFLSAKPYFGWKDETGDASPWYHLKLYDNY
tara:strand:+ start:148 stop:471 length:324 start_codon:yes stop_codon:yes gene_type:complete